MNILLEKLKNGSGIHIKESLKGSFTRWCGGNVTDECIRRGKNSSNPKIRKKATFADNARHFKHKSGGKAFVKGVNILDSNSDAYKLVKKKVKMRLWGGPMWLDNITINNSPDVMRHYYWRDFVQEYAERKKLEKALLDALEALQKAEEENRYYNLANTLGSYLLNNIGGKKKNSTNNVPPSKNTIGNSSYLTNTGNTGMLSANQNSLNFFGINS